MANCMIALAALLVVAGFCSVASAGSKKVVCYYGSWTVYRQGKGKFEVEYIDPTLCTHLIYAFVGVSTEGAVKILDGWNDLPDNYGKDAMGRFNKLRANSPNTKTLVAIGGWNEGSSGFSTVVNNPTTRAKFVKDIVAFIQKHDFNGFDLDWEYPAQRGGVPSDKDGYVSLVKELRAEFDKHGFLLSAAVGVGRYLVGASYDVAVLSKNLDFINMMAYDLHGTWDGVTGENAPLYASSKDTTADARLLNVDTSIKYWIQNGAAPEKMVLGMGTYGRSFTLSNPAEHGVGAASSGPGSAGSLTGEAGMLGYNEICANINKGWTVTWNDEQKVPYAYSGNQWVGYDNVDSIKIKTQYALSLGLGGAMIWSVETDDFLGECHGYKYPLLHAINDVLNGGNSGGGQTSSSTSTTSTTTPTTTTGSSGGSDPSHLCTRDGYVRDPSNCQVFYQCVPAGNGAYTPIKFQCADGLAFDTSINACNYKAQVNC